MEKRSLSIGPETQRLPPHSSASSTSSSSSSSRNHDDDKQSNGLATTTTNVSKHEFCRKVDAVRSSSAIGDRHRRKSESKGCERGSPSDDGSIPKRHRHSATDDEQTPNDDDGYHRGSTYVLRAR